MGYIYLLIDKRNGKCYVGKHNGKKKDYWGSGLIPNKIAKKYGKDIFERLIVEDNIEDNFLNEREIFYIEKYDSFKNGYNITTGGDGGGEWINYKTEEEKRLISEKRSKSLMGRTFTDETKEKMSKSHTGKKLSDKHKKNIGKAVKLRGGIPHTEETKEKLSKIMSGRSNPKHSSFMKENNPKNQKVSIDGIIFKSIKEASEVLNISRSTIKNRLKSKNFTTWFKIK